MIPLQNAFVVPHDENEFEVDNNDNQLEVVCETGKNEYKKHFIALNEWTMYVVEDIGGASVNKYQYEVNYIPEAIKKIRNS